MLVDEFWSLIELSHAKGGGSIERQTGALTEMLSGYETKDILAFDQHFAEQNRALYTWELWGAAYYLLGGCSDDVFNDFRSWVVAQGRDYASGCAKDPAILADGRLDDEEEIGEAELLAYAASDIYSRRTGREIYEDFPDLPGTFPDEDPAGTEFDEDELEAKYPGLNPL